MKGGTMAGIMIVVIILLIGIALGYMSVSAQCGGERGIGAVFKMLLTFFKC